MAHFHRTPVSSGLLTGIAQLDLAMGRPGIPQGKVTEVYGFTASGKTTLALHLIAECQKMGGSALFIDTTASFEQDLARKLNVDSDRLWIFQSHRVEPIFDRISD